MKLRFLYVLISVYSALGIYASAQQTSIVPLPGKRAVYNAVYHESKIYIAKGDEILEYNGHSVDVLSTRENVSAEEVMIAEGSKLFFGAGSEVQVYDLANESWSSLRLSEVRSSGLAATTINGKILFAGGLNELGDGLASVDIFDANTGSWSPASLSEPRGNVGTVVSGDLAFFIGGITSSTHASSVMDIYNAKDNTWSTTALPAPMAYANATVAGECLYIKGRYVPFGDDIVDIYHIPSGTWSVLHMPIASFSAYCNTVGRQVIFSVAACYDGLSNEINIYDTISQTWIAMRRLGNMGYAMPVVSGNQVIFTEVHRNQPDAHFLEVVDFFESPVIAGH